MAYQETFNINYNGNVLVYGQYAIDYQTQTMEYCLTNYDAGRYNLDMSCNGCNGWYPGSTVEVRGAYGNTFFKGYLHSQYWESVQFQAGYFLKRNGYWMFRVNDAPENWYANSVSSEGWGSTVSGTLIPTSTGTQYFRIQLWGSPIAGYQFAVLYQHGIVVYVNGAEVARDHMPEGPVNSTTLATESYPSNTEHYFMRNAYDWGSSYSPAFAVEIHPAAGVEMTNIEFEAWLAPMGQTVSQYQCHGIPIVPVITSSTGGYTTSMYDYNDETFFSAEAGQDVTITFTYANLFAEVNGLEIYSGNYYTSSPSSFVLYGVRGEEMDILLRADNQVYDSYTTFVKTAPFTIKNYNTFKLKMTASGSSQYTLPEVRLMVCNLATPTQMYYTPNSFVVYAQFESVNPTLNSVGFSTCSVSPPLPQGVTLNSESCEIYGTPQVAFEETEFTITSESGIGYTATLRIKSVVCQQNMIQLKRTYKSSASRESYSITNEAGVVVLEELANSGQTSYSVKYLYLCLPDGRYKLTLDVDSVVYWYSESYLELFKVVQYNEYEQILRSRYDNNLHLPTVYYFDAEYLVKGLQQWYYKMGSVPSQWYNSNVDGWGQGVRGAFPASSNAIQLYKKTFTVGSLQHASAFTISIRYLYGCVVYMNGIEVFRNRVTGDLSDASTSSGYYSGTAIFHRVSLPVTTYALDDTSAQHYLVEGENTIAIALVANSAQQTTSDFDATVYLVDDPTSSRAFGYTITCSGMSGTCSYLWNDNYKNTVYRTSTSCIDNYSIIKFSDDRREWIGSYSLTLEYQQKDRHVNSFQLFARNDGDAEWTQLDVQTGWQYWEVGQTKKAYLRNNRPYNQYKFVNFKNDGEDCSWKLSNARIFTEQTDLEVPELSYSEISVYKDIEMAEEFPSSELYYNFRVDPALPSGMKIDPPSGAILGTPRELMSQKEYTITAYRYNGPEATTVVPIIVDRCYGGKSLITVKIRTDSSPSTIGYQIFEGRGVEGNIYRELFGLPSSSSLFYVDSCAPHGIYTLQTMDDSTTGWSTPAGYMLSVDIGELVFDLNQMPTSTTKAKQTTVFYSFLPFQMEFDAWSVWNVKDSVPSNWLDTAYEVTSTWKSLISSEITSSESATFYVRRTFEIPHLSEVSVLNVRVRFTGGLVGYFNGRRMVRFNMPDAFNQESEALSPRNADKVSKFHIVLATVGAVSETNVIGFEIHRNPGAKLSDPVAFGATGVFGAQDCSPVINTFEYAYVTSLSSGKLESLFDMDVTTYASFTNSKTFVLQWKFENQEPVRFNGYAFQPGTTFSSFGWSLHTRELDEDDWNLAHQTDAESFTQRVRKELPSVGSMLGHRNYQLRIDDTASSTPRIYEFMFMYCKASGNYCEGEGDYPPVAEGSISPSVCPEGFIGYTYRECMNGKLGPPKTDECRYKIPTDLLYPTASYTFVMDTEVSTGLPTYKNIIQSFFLEEHVYLPLGLELDPKTGEIHGVPIEEQTMTAYTIYGKNERAAAMFVLSIQVRKGTCIGTGFFPTTQVGNVATYDCSLQGSFVGTQKCACLLGKRDGEWQKVTGMCFSTSMIVMLIVMLFLVIVAAIFFVIRSSRRAKAVGGIKNKPAVLKKSGASANQKAVKV